MTIAPSDPFENVDYHPVWFVARFGGGTLAVLVDADTPKRAIWGNVVA